ncbi:MAG: GntR family transcriptional regulator [Acidobacteriota bacterium]
MILTLTELSPEPLHTQISRQIRARILSREIGGGEVLPSIRGLAREYRVSAITVQRAYEDLEREKLLLSHPGKGFYVVEHPQTTTTDMAARRFSVAFAELVRQGRAEGLGEVEIRGAIEAVMGLPGGSS